MEDHGRMNLYFYSIISELEGQRSRLTRNTELPGFGLDLEPLWIRELTQSGMGSCILQIFKIS